MQNIDHFVQALMCQRKRLPLPIYWLSDPSETLAQMITMSIKGVFVDDNMSENEKRRI